VVNLPETGNSPPGDWRLVRAIVLSIDSRSTIPVRAAGSPDGSLHLTDTVEISPRNFVFSTSTPAQLDPVLAMGDPRRGQRGSALLLVVLLGIMLLVAAGAVIVLSVDRSADLDFAFQRDIVGSTPRRPAFTSAG
jgi:hypothetical protein